MNKQGTLTAGRPSATKNRAATLASLADEASMKRVNFELSSEQHTKLKIYATLHGKTIKDLLTEFVAQLPDV
jgi:hypothetical protein